jgi:hypothetical protein
MSDPEAITELLQEVKSNIVRLQSEKGLKASGQSALSLRIETRPEEGELYGDSYFIQQESGRRPGPLGNVQGLYDWLAYKKYGLSYASDKARWSIAWAIAKKQARQGSYTYRHGPTGVLSEALTDAMVEKFTASVAISKIDGMLDEIKKAFV